MKLDDLIPYICYFPVYFSQNRFNLKSYNVAPCLSKVLARLEFFLCLYSLFVFLNRRFLFCHTVYCISILV